MIRAQYKGKLFGDVVECYVLDDGPPPTRVIAKVGAFRALTAATGNGSLERYLERLPKRFAHLSSLPTSEFRLPNGVVGHGMRAENFADILAAYVDALGAGELHPAQVPLAINASRLLVAVAKVGIVALVDEATGYQRVREENELRGLVARYLREEPAGWQRLWDDAVVGRLCQVYGIERRGNLFPAFACTVISKLYQRILPGEVYAEMKARNGAGDDRLGKHHQFFQDSLWRFVHNDIPTIAYFAKVSRNRDEFWGHINARYAGDGFQPELFSDAQ